MSVFAVNACTVTASRWLLGPVGATSSTTEPDLECPLYTPSSQHTLPLQARLHARTWAARGVRALSYCLSWKWR
eukprot:5711-Heterococcus_DN1.PRE.3